MISQLREWLRLVNLSMRELVLVPGVILAVWIFEWSLYAFVRWTAATNAPLLSEAELNVPKVLPLHLIAIGLAAVGYGYFRGKFFHPVINKSYGTWLAQTPWQFPLPLPAGPAHLVWQDAAVILLLMAFAVLPPYRNEFVGYIPVAFLVAYCGCAAVAFAWLELYWPIVGMVVFLGIGGLLALNSWLCLVSATAMYGVAYLGICKSLREFPYTEVRRLKIRLVAFEQQQPVEVTLPIAPTSDSGSEFWMRARHGVLIGALVGGLFFCAAFHGRREPEFIKNMMIVQVPIVFVAAVSRLAQHLMRHGAPISLFGRIATRRWLIPKFDYVLIAPFVSLLAGFGLPFVLMGLGTAPLVAIPLCAGLGVALALALPPHYEDWYYTAHYRLRNARRIGQTFVES